MAGLALLLVALAAWMIASQYSGSFWPDQAAMAQAAFEEATGIRLVRVASTAQGGMIDLQYQVMDPDKALIIHDDENPPTLIDDATGLVLATPFHDHGFKKLRPALTYHVLIVNGDGLLKRGSTVTLIVGQSRLEHVVVQ